MEEGEDVKAGEAIARDLMQKLGVRPEQLIESGYIDLLMTASCQPNPLNT